MLKRNKSFIIFVSITIVLILITIGASVFFQINSMTFNAELKDLVWPKGPILITMDTAGNSDEMGGVTPGYYVFSSDGKLSMYFGSSSNGYGIEFLSPQKILIAGGLTSSKPEIENKTGLYYIEKNQVNSIDSTLLKNNFSEFSLSPSKKYLRYWYTENQKTVKLCIAKIDLEKKIDNCVEVIEKIPDEWDFNQNYLIDSEWLNSEDKYIIKIRSRSESHYEPSNYPNQPPLLIQNEVKRFSYDPEKDEIKEINLEDQIILKTKNIFFNSQDQPLIDYFDPKKGDYEIISNRRDQEVGIREKSTGKKAKLSDAAFLGEMTGFDLYWYSK